MDEHREELATLESIDSGAVYTLALKTHVGMSIDTFRYFAGWCDKIQVRFNSHCRNQQFRLYVKILYTIKGFWSRDISYSICEICIHTVHDVLLKWWNVNHNKTVSERFEIQAWMMDGELHLMTNLSKDEFSSLKKTLLNISGFDYSNQPRTTQQELNIHQEGAYWVIKQWIYNIELTCISLCYILWRMNKLDIKQCIKFFICQIYLGKLQRTVEINLFLFYFLLKFYFFGGKIKTQE